jgi:DNA-binding NarL/FixJ family response regulator
LRTRVLLVDDHPPVLKQIQNLLAGEFDIVGVADDGETMIAGAAELKPDLIVADIAMPRLDGIEASRRILKDQPRLPIILLTMQNDRQIMQQALRVGVRGYVLKLTAGEDLIPAMREALEGRTFVSSFVE